MSTALPPQKEQDGLGLESHEYRVKIGQVACEIQIVSERVIHCSVNESLGTAEGQLPITVSGWGTGPPSRSCPPVRASQLSTVMLRRQWRKAELHVPTGQMRKLKTQELSDLLRLAGPRAVVPGPPVTTQHHGGRGERAQKGGSLLRCTCLHASGDGELTPFLAAHAPQSQFCRLSPENSLAPLFLGYPDR